MDQIQLKQLYRKLVDISGAESAKMIIIKNYPHAEAAVFDNTNIPKAALYPSWMKPSARIIPEVTNKPQVVKKVSGGSKIDQAKSLYKQYSDKSKSEIIDMFIAQLAMTKAGATTYYYTCKKG